MLHSRYQYFSGESTPPDIEGGGFSGAQTHMAESTYATYTCHYGYQMDGSNVSVCVFVTVVGPTRLHAHKVSGHISIDVFLFKFELSRVLRAAKQRLSRTLYSIYTHNILRTTKGL